MVRTLCGMTAGAAVLAGLAVSCGLTERNAASKAADDDAVATEGVMSSSGGGGGATTGATGGRGGSGGADPDISGRATGGDAGSGGSIANERVRYAACDWEWTQSSVTRVQVARWDDTRCICTVAVFAEVEACPTEVRSEGWCLTGVRQSDDAVDCDNARGDGSVPLAAWGSVEGLATGTLAMDLEFAFESDGLKAPVHFESGRCHTNCSLDCEAPDGTYPDVLRPEQRRVVVTHACDHFDVWIYEPSGFLIGAQDWALAIGDVRFSRHRYVDGYAVVFSIPDDEFAALEDGAVIQSGYGSPDVIYGYLDKGEVL